MVNFESKGRYGVYDLRKIVSLLRGPGGCPWDAEQTHESISRNLVEEAYEVAEAIEERDADHLCEELGDVLMQVVFHSDIEERAGVFDLDDVADRSVRKLISRHPHVFGGDSVSSSAEVLDRWDALKRREKNLETVADSMDAVSRALPALWRAEKIQKKAAKVGFDWPSATGALDKLREELSELEQAVKSGEGAFEELGDLLFSAVNVARFVGADPEEALNAACEKFVSRFRRLEESASSQGKSLEEMSLAEMDALYEQTKRAF